MFRKLIDMPLETKAGWLGVVFLQGATLPSMIGNIAGWSRALPPFSMVILVWIGLACYLFRAVKQRDVVYMTSNGVGLFLNTILLALIALPRY